MARLRTGVTDGCAGIDTAGPRGGACSRQYGFKKCGFTALERAHQCDAPWTAGTSDVLSHCRLLMWSSARDWVGNSVCSSSVIDLARKKIAAVHRAVERPRKPSLRGAKATKQSRVQVGRISGLRSLSSGAHSRDPLAIARNDARLLVTCPDAVPGFPNRQRRSGRPGLA